MFCLCRDVKLLNKSSVDKSHVYLIVQSNRKKWDMRPGCVKLGRSQFYHYCTIVCILRVPFGIQPVSTPYNYSSKLSITPFIANVTPAACQKVTSDSRKVLSQKLLNSEVSPTPYLLYHRGLLFLHICVIKSCYQFYVLCYSSIIF